MEKDKKEQVMIISYTFILGFPKHLKPTLIIISLNRGSKWDSQLSVLPKVILQLANSNKNPISLISVSCPLILSYRFCVWQGKEMGRMIFLVPPAPPSLVNPLKLIIDCIWISFPSHLFYSGRILAGWEVRMTSSSLAVLLCHSHSSSSFQPLKKHVSPHKCC